jgi:hypothetical protein
MAWIIRYDWPPPTSKIQYRSGRLNTYNRDEADLLSFSEALQIVEKHQDARTIFGIKTSMEEEDDSSEKPSQRIQHGSLQTTNASKKKFRGKKSTVEVGEQRSGIEEDPLLHNYYTLGRDYIKKYSTRPSDETLLKRIELMSAKQVRSLKLEEPFPSPPFRNAKYGIWHIDGENRSYCNFCTMYAAKHAFNLLLRGCDYKFLDSKTVKLSDDRVLKSDDLEDIIEYELSDLEETFIMPEPYKSYFRGRAIMDIPEESKEPVKKTQREERAIRSVSAKKTNSSDITPADIAYQLKITPQVVRAQLRKMKIGKPYLWDAQEGSGIIERVAKSIKK